LIFSIVYCLYLPIFNFLFWQSGLNPAMQKEGVHSFCLCFKFDLHYFDFFFFALGSFLKLIFFSISSFDIKLVRNWTLWFFTIGWSWSHDLDHRFEMLTRIEINLFYILLFNDFTFQCHHSPFCVWYNHIFIGE
jgi:hypothetical protein